MRILNVLTIGLSLLLGVGLTPAQVPRLATPDTENLVRWIGDACPALPDPMGFMRLDQVAGKAVNDWLRTGRYREAHALAVRYLDCLKPFDGREEDLVSTLVGPRVNMLEQVLCFLPLVLTEVEQKVDPDVTASSLKRCPRPAEIANGDADWAESVRRYLHLLAAVRPPREVLEASLKYLAAMRKAGLPMPGVEPEGPPGGAQTESDKKTMEDTEVSAPEGGEPPSPPEIQGPDPVFAAMVLGVAAAVASGDIDALLQVVGATSVDDACSSSFLAALGVMQALPLPRRAALPILQGALVSRVPWESRLHAVDAAIARFGSSSRKGKPCVIPQVVASLVLSSFDSDTVDQAVAEGRVESVARVVATASIPVSWPGSPASRVEVLRVVAARAEGDEERARWLCALGDACLAAGQVRESVEAFDTAFSLERHTQNRCASIGRLRARIADPDAAFEEVESAAGAFLEEEPDALTIYGLISDAPDARAKATVIRALQDAARALSARKGSNQALDAVQEAFIKIVDRDPGSDVARIALDAIQKIGEPKDPGERMILGLVLGRHYVVVRREKDAMRVFQKAFSSAGPDIEGAKEGTAALLRWLAVNDHVRVLDRVVDMARRSGVADPPILAQVGAIRGERGDIARARALLRLAVLARPTSPEDWVVIADAYARIGDPTSASGALDKAGPEATWDRRHFMIRGRIEMDRRRYREAAAAYTKAADLSRGDCEPLFFRGLVRLLLGDADGAVEDFEQCIALGDDSHQVLGGLAYAHFDQSSWEEAERVFRRALAKDEKTADNHIGLALTLFRMGRLEEARRSYERAVELEPAMKKGYTEAEKKGYVYSSIEKKAWAEMLEAFRKAGWKR